MFVWQSVIELAGEFKGPGNTYCIYSSVLHALCKSGALLLGMSLCISRDTVCYYQLLMLDCGRLHVYVRLSQLHLCLKPSYHVLVTWPPGFILNPLAGWQCTCDLPTVVEADLYDVKSIFGRLVAESGKGTVVPESVSSSI